MVMDVIWRQLCKYDLRKGVYLFRVGQVCDE